MAIENQEERVESVLSILLLLVGEKGFVRQGRLQIRRLKGWGEGGGACSRPRLQA